MDRRRGRCRRFILLCESLEKPGIGSLRGKVVYCPMSGVRRCGIYDILRCFRFMHVPQSAFIQLTFSGVFGTTCLIRCKEFGPGLANYLVVKSLSERVMLLHFLPARHQVSELLG